MMREPFVSLSIWLVIAAVAGAIGRFAFEANFWVGAGLALLSLAVNGLIIEWEDRKPGGWGE
jgi:hypothetical protein